jgi:2'-5' RNA ligase
VRLFVGVELGDAVRTAASDAVERLRQRLGRSRVDMTARWVDAENLHITLWFIGEVHDERAIEISTALRPPFATSMFPLTVEGCGAFPSSGLPRTLWFGVTAGRDSMADIHAELQRRLAPLGFEAEKRPYSPHVTIARVKEIRRDAARQARDILSAFPADCGSCLIQAVTLFRSRLSSRGSRYESLLRVPLS